MNWVGAGSAVPGDHRPEHSEALPPRTLCRDSVCCRPPQGLPPRPSGHGVPHGCSQRAPWEEPSTENFCPRDLSLSLSQRPLPWAPPPTCASSPPTGGKPGAGVQGDHLPRVSCHSADLGRAALAAFGPGPYLQWNSAFTSSGLVLRLQGGPSIVGSLPGWSGGH